MGPTGPVVSMLSAGLAGTIGRMCGAGRREYEESGCHVVPKTEDLCDKQPTQAQQK